MSIIISCISIVSLVEGEIEDYGRPEHKLEVCIPHSRVLDVPVEKPPLNQPRVDKVQTIKTDDS